VFSPLDVQVLESIASGLAQSASAWQLEPDQAPDQRHYRRLVVTDTYDAWLIYWPSGTGLELHDHGDSAGAFQVVDGVLDEARPHAIGLDVRRVGVGQQATFEAGDVHAVNNRSGAPATSVHAYSPPLSKIEFFATSDDAALRSVSVDAGSWAERR